MRRTSLACQSQSSLYTFLKRYNSKVEEESHLRSLLKNSCQFRGWCQWPFLLIPANTSSCCGFLSHPHSPILESSPCIVFEDPENTSVHIDPYNYSFSGKIISNIQMCQDASVEGHWLWMKKKTPNTSILNQYIYHHLDVWQQTATFQLVIEIWTFEHAIFFHMLDTLKLAWHDIRSTSGH